MRFWACSNAKVSPRSRIGCFRSRTSRVRTDARASCASPPGSSLPRKQLLELCHVRAQGPELDLFELAFGKCAGQELLGSLDEAHVLVVRDERKLVAARRRRFGSGTERQHELLPA